MRKIFALRLAYLAAALFVCLVAAFGNIGSVNAAGLVNLELQNTTVVDGIKALFEGSGYKYAIDPGIKGKIVELTIKGVTFDQALKEFASAADFTYRVENGTYFIIPAKTATATVPNRTILERGTATQSPAEEQLPAAPPPAPTQVVVTQNAPVVYTQQAPPAAYGYGYGGYGYPPYYSAGNINYAYGWPPYNLASDNPYILNVGYPPPPPPPGWLPYGMERFLRAANAMSLRPYFTTAYPNY